MPKESFNGINISSLVYQVSGEGVSQRMDAVAFGYPGFFLRGKKPFEPLAHSYGFRLFGLGTTISQDDIYTNRL
jgi:hypothetical protein